jgi:hypothetical protein
MPGFKSKRAAALDKIRVDMTQEEAKAFIRKITGPERRRITGEDRKHLLMIFAMLTPNETSNNQHTLTEVYYYSNNTYHVTYGFGYPDDQDDPWVEMILDTEI